MDESKVDKARIQNTLGKMGHYLRSHNSICVSISGGSDSDIILHLICKNFQDQLYKVHFVFSNTGVEYRATLNHLDDLEQKYGIKIERVKGVPIPVAVKKYGVPFVSKQVSEYMGRLQRHGFDFQNDSLKPFDKLYGKYNKCKSSLRWWCNDWGDGSRFNISWNKYLKSYLVENNPQFQVSSICCQKSKKEPLIKFQKSVDCDLVVTGERKSEGGSVLKEQVALKVLTEWITICHCSSGMTILRHIIKSMKEYGILTAMRSTVCPAQDALAVRLL